MVFPTISFIARCQITHSFEFLVACAIQTSVPRPPTNCPLDPRRVSVSVILLLRRATGVLMYPLARSSSPAMLYLMRLTFRLRLHSLDRTLDFLLQDLLPAPASSTSDVRQTRASDDASDPVGLDPAILWHGAAYMLPQVPRQTTPTSTSSGASAATAGSRFDIHYSRRPRPAPAPAPQAVVPQPAKPPARETRSQTGSLPPPRTTIWVHCGGLQLGVAAARLHPRRTCRCKLARGND